MPELPEVETVRRGLEPHLLGAVLKTVIQNRPDLRFPFPRDFVRRLEDRRVLALTRRAKFLLWALDSGETLIVHLGMTGRFMIDGSALAAFALAPGPLEKHTHVVFETDRAKRVLFSDVRRFGFMDLAETETLARHVFFRDLGPEPLDGAFTSKTLGAALSGRVQNIKATLLQQDVVAGLGNIYVCEALHRSRIDPRRPAGALSPPEVRRLVQEIRAVLEAAIQAGGSTLRDYRSATGELGYFQHAFTAYGREEQACLRPGCRGVISRIVQGGRSTFFCERCQR